MQLQHEATVPPICSLGIAGGTSLLFQKTLLERTDDHQKLATLATKL